MIPLAELLLALLLITHLALAGTGRLRTAIRLVAAQGWIIGLLPLLLERPGAELGWSVVFNTLIKGVALPALLLYAAKRAKATFELEPLVGFRTSQAIVFLLAVGGFFLGKKLHIHEAVVSELAVSAAFATMATGLFLLCARRKAITQVLGFLVFENGIALFRADILLDYGLIAELGVLLDVFVLVFVLGIAIHQIDRTFSSIDVDKLNRLGDDDSHPSA